MKKVHFITLGCKTNQYETNSMEQMLLKNNYEITDGEADIYIINTCAVTNMAERKSREMIRRAKKENPEATIVAAGCYSQVAKDKLGDISELDLIIGINEKNHLVEILNNYFENKESNIIVSDVMHDESYIDFGSTTYTELTRAIVKIQDGCDRFCSYCLIPYARGKVRSRDPNMVIEEVENIASKGFKEVVITGIHIASYGKDFGTKGEEYRKEFGLDSEFSKYDDKDDLHSGEFRFIDLLEQIDKIEGIERIRIGSIEPKWINEDIVERLSKLKKLCHQFHLSLQSGCDSTLKRMNRRYTTQEFENSARMIRLKFEDAILTTDIIVGFPGEDDEEFNQTYNFLKRINFYRMHIFKYSVRSGTKAEKMPNQVSPEIKEIRSKKLIELSNENEKKYNENYIGSVVEVLFEEADKEYFKGHTANYLYVKVPLGEINGEDIENKILNVKIRECKNLDIIGDIVV